MLWRTEREVFFFVCFFSILQWIILLYIPPWSNCVQLMCLAGPACIDFLLTFWMEWQWGWCIGLQCKISFLMFYYILENNDLQLSCNLDLLFTMRQTMHWEANSLHFKYSCYIWLKRKNRRLAEWISLKMFRASITKLKYFVCDLQSHWWASFAYSI